jgi:hypothetical protein
MRKKKSFILISACSMTAYEEDQSTRSLKRASILLTTSSTIGIKNETVSQRCDRRRDEEDGLAARFDVTILPLALL